MGMSTHIVGVRDLDGKFQQMMDIKLACDKADIDYPPEMIKYFEDGGAHRTEIKESADYLRKELECLDINDEAIVDYEEEMCDGVEIDISKLSPEIKKIRFYNAY